MTDTDLYLSVIENIYEITETQESFHTEIMNVS